MTSNLAFQTDERELRQSYYARYNISKAGTPKNGGLTPSQSLNLKRLSTAKHEEIKVDLEGVILERSQKKNLHGSNSISNPVAKTLNKLLTIPTKKDKKSFYYSENNEISSIEDFFKIFKEFEIKRQAETKLALKERLEAKRKLIEDIHESTTQNSSRKGTNTCSSPVNKLSRPQSATILGFSSIKSRPNSVNGRSSSQEKMSISFPVKQPSVEYLQIPQDSQLNLSPIAKQINQAMQDTNISKPGMTKQQKFTEKEIYRHLMHMTVSPKPLKRTASAMKKERFLSLMYKDSKVLGQTIENTILKANNSIIKRSEEEPITNVDPYLIRRSIEMHSFANSSTITTKQEDKMNYTRITESINQGINNIEQLLKTRPMTPQNHDSNHKKSKSLVLRQKNPFPLRSSVEQKHKIFERINLYRKSSEDLKKTTNMYIKEVGENKMTNQTYLNLYL